MSKMIRITTLFVALLLMANGFFYAALADHNRRQERRRYQERHRNSSEHNGNTHLTPVNNRTYRETCGSCHFAYQPELLPSGSWGKILANPSDHFGEEIKLDPESKRIIGEYLKANAAEYSSAKLAVKIMRSLGSQTPLRITDIPYIRKEHEDEVSPDVLKRKSIGSLSNCSACHTTADQGIYDDKYVVIPR